MIAMPKDLQEAVRRAGDQPVRLTDLETNAEYVVVPAKVFEGLTSGMAPQVLSREEQARILVAAGRKVGWDDPAMDVYNDLDPRRP
jgi:hypothetical protein